MSIDELCALPVEALAAKDCLLFLWATFPMLPEALQLSQKFHQTIVMITHNNEIAQLADRIIRIEDGRISE